MLKVISPLAFLILAHQEILKNFVIKFKLKKVAEVGSKKKEIVVAICESNMKAAVTAARKEDRAQSKSRTLKGHLRKL